MWLLCGCHTKAYQGGWMLGDRGTGGPRKVRFSPNGRVPNMGLDSPSSAILLRIQVLLALKKGELLQKGFRHRFELKVSCFGETSTKGFILSERLLLPAIQLHTMAAFVWLPYYGCSNWKNCNGSNLMCSVKFSQRFPSAMNVTSRSNWLGGCSIKLARWENLRIYWRMLLWWWISWSWQYHDDNKHDVNGWKGDSANSSSSNAPYFSPWAYNAASHLDSTWIPPGFHFKQYLEKCSFPFNLRRMKIYSFKTVFR